MGISWESQGPGTNAIPPGTSSKKTNVLPLVSQVRLKGFRLWNSRRGRFDVVKKTEKEHSLIKPKYRITEFPRVGREVSGSRPYSSTFLRGVGNSGQRTWGLVTFGMVIRPQEKEELKTVICSGTERPNSSCLPKKDFGYKQTEVEFEIIRTS